MSVLTTWMLAATLPLTPVPGGGLPQQIHVHCRYGRALERAIARAKTLGEVDIYLHGVCEGNFVIATDGITLRGATPGSGLAAPARGSTGLPVLEVVDAQASLRGVVVRGGEVGVVARGWDAEVLLYEVDVQGQTAVGVVASRGATIRVIDTTVRDGGVGIAADSDGELNLQNVVVSHQRVGVVVTDNSFAAINDTTIANNRDAGLSVDNRSDANVIGGAFRDNGGVHIDAGDWGSVTLLSTVTIGSEKDATAYALGAARGARIASFSTPVIHGDVSALDGGSIRMGNTVLDGDLIVLEFADAYVRDGAITGSVYCFDGADAICSSVTTGGSSGCPSPTCGTATAEAAARASAIPEFPVIAVPRFDLPRRARPPM